MDPPETPTPARWRAGAGMLGPADLSDLLSARRRPGAAGASIDDQGITALSPMRPAHLRPRGSLTPTPAAASKKVRTADPPEETGEAAAVQAPAAHGTQPAQEEAHAATRESADKPTGRPARQAAIEANASLTRKAQLAALGLGSTRTPPGSLGSILGISPRTVEATAATGADADLEEAAGADMRDRESSAPGSQPGTVGTERTATQTLGPAKPGNKAAKDDIGRRIANIEKQQRNRAEATTRLCRVVDEVCQSGALSISGAEIVRAAVYLALAHSQLGPAAADLSPKIAKFLTECDPAKPSAVQPPVAAATGTESLPLTAEEQRGKQTVVGTANGAPRRWERAEAKARPRPPSAIVASLPADNEFRALLPHETLARVNTALEEANVPQHVRMGSSALTRAGIAIKPTHSCTVDELAQHSAVIRSALNASQVHDSRQWLRYKVIGVPVRVGNLVLTEDLLQKEIEQSTRLRLVRAPHRLRLEGQENARYSSVQFAVIDDGKTRKPRTVTILGFEYKVACKLAPRMDKRRGQWTRLTPGQVSAVKNQARIDHAAAVKALAKARSSASQAERSGANPDDATTTNATAGSAATGTTLSAGAPSSA
ncbi:hypothetical protein OC844_005934 [Tilletia horrida]|nr:hypothetical protein OC844_005934 [Tilletia horrida]